MIHTNKAFKNMDFSLDELVDIKTALDQAIIIAVTDQRGIIQSVNDHFCRISKYERHELIGFDHKILNSGVHPKVFFKEMWRKIGSGEIWQGEICNRAKDGALYWVKTTIVPFLNEVGKPYQYVSLRTDITAEKNMQKLTQIAYHDDLTGLPNRRNLMERIAEEIKISNHTNEKFALFFIDVNRFKNINDSLGHKVGDLFLKEFATRITSIDDQGNSCFRMNGDEFVYILNDISQIDILALKIFDVLKENFSFYEYEFFITISMGISIYPDHGEKVSQLLRKADIAMYEAKSKRGNAYIIYNNSLKNTNDQLLILETKLHKALKNNIFELYYQPKYCIETKTIIGMEALIRWFDKDEGYIPPNQFIPLAEQCGMISAIGRWVLRQAMCEMRDSKKIYNHDLRMAVNISPIHIAEIDFVKQVKEILEEEQVDPHLLEIEITEMTMMNYSEDLIDKIKELKEMGITISIDDFGTGYSNLSYLKEFPVDTLKIDRSFIQNIQNENSGIAMIEAIIKLAHALKLKVVAEGVEFEKELNVLQRYNCEFVQGFYFSKPLNKQQFHELLKEQLSI